MTLPLLDPVCLAAIDAGSNAIRLSIASAHSPLELRKLASERYPVRLGHEVFVKRKFPAETISAAAKVFRHFRALMDRYRVSEYRAVATSATREARNRSILINRIRRTTGIKLEVISGEEEAQLVRTAVLAALGPGRSPRIVVDLGGGSLELNLLREGALERSIQLPIGTVRLMEFFGIRGGMDDEQVEEVRDYVRSLLASRLPGRDLFRGGMAVACGGNAEVLAHLAAGPRERGFETINLRLLRDEQWEIARRGIHERMKAFGIRRDRAEVIGIAAVVFMTLGRWLGIERYIVPGVGVREGVLYELAIRHFLGGPLAGEEDRERILLADARVFARRMGAGEERAERIRELAVSLFDQLAPRHHLSGEARAAIELAAILEDVGRFVHRSAPHKHSEYLVRYGDIAGLKGPIRDIVACLVRYSDRGRPRRSHKLYASLDPASRRQVRLLAAILQIANGLAAMPGHRVTAVRVRETRRQVFFALRMRGEARGLLDNLQKKAELFESEFRVRARFGKVRSR